MRKPRFLVLFLLAASAAFVLSIRTQAAKTSVSTAALAGQVSSTEEGPMEGVLVSAKKEGTRVTVTVVSDAQGHFSFPRTRLEPGDYFLRVRAAGYDLNDAGPVEINPARTTQHDLKLRKTQDLAAQLSNQDWLLSAPGTEQEKRRLLYCGSCHTLERVFRSYYNSFDLSKVVARMHTYSRGTTPMHPQWVPTGGFNFPGGVPEYLSTVNRSSSGTWSFPLKTLPRPKGKATQAIVTEYDIPRQNAEPHDVLVDKQGFVWYSDFGSQWLGKLDPKTAKVVEYPVPMLRPAAPEGEHGLDLDDNGNLWLGMSSQGAAGQFDPKSEKFKFWNSPKDPDSEALPSVQTALPENSRVDGGVWFYSQGKIQRLNIRTGEFLPHSIDPFKNIPKDSPAATRPHAIYDIASDSHNNCYFLDLGSEFIGKIDAKTLQVTFYQIPTPNSWARRGHFDSQDRLWFAEYLGNKMAMLDTKTGKFQEWEMPAPYNWPYDVVLDKNGDAWTAGMISDRVTRLNPKTGEMTDYLLPRPTNIRNVNLDNSTTPVSFWVGSNDGASIVRVEPLQ